MAVIRETIIKKWNCVSSDTRPTEDVTEGSKVHYIDTGEKYIYHDGTWEPDRSLIYAFNAI